MKKMVWSLEKNRELKNNPNRSVCFEDIVAAIDSGGLLDDVVHMNGTKYPHQRLLVVLFNNYVYGVPYVSNDEGIFLKTIYPSRKLTEHYLKGGNDE
jgi:hypothetical protein